MTREPTTPNELLSWILSTLRTELGLNASTCFLTTDDLAPAQIPPASTFVTVTPLTGAFQVNEQTGENVYELWGFRVRVYLRVSRDRAGVDEARLTDAEDGMFAWKKRILAALCGRDIPVADIGGTIAATSCTSLQWLEGSRSDLQYVSFAIDFDLPFCWALG